MQHWADTLDAATSIVAAKAKQMNNDRLLMYVGFLVLGVILIGAIAEIVRTLNPKEKDEPRMIAVPEGASILILPSGAEAK